MFFTPNLKRKRGGNNKWLVQPFPKLESEKQYEGVFTGISVEVSTKEDIIALYDSGFYGKGSHSRSMPLAVLKSSHAKDAFENETDNRETLCLGLEEAFFLSYYLKVLKICDMDSKEMSFETFLPEALEVNTEFVESLAAYLYLKSKGWVVKSGLKFGGHFCKYYEYFQLAFVIIILYCSNLSQGSPLLSRQFCSRF